MEESGKGEAILYLNIDLILDSKIQNDFSRKLIAQLNSTPLTSNWEKTMSVREFPRTGERY